LCMSHQDAFSHKCLANYDVCQGTNAWAPQESEVLGAEEGKKSEFHSSAVAAAAPLVEHVAPAADGAKHGEQKQSAAERAEIFCRQEMAKPIEIRQQQMVMMCKQLLEESSKAYQQKAKGDSSWEDVEEEDRQPIISGLLKEVIKIEIEEMTSLVSDFNFRELVAKDQAGEAAIQQSRDKSSAEDVRAAKRRVAKQRFVCKCVQKGCDNTSGGYACEECKLPLCSLHKDPKSHKCRVRFGWMEYPEFIESKEKDREIRRDFPDDWYKVGNEDDTLIVDKRTKWAVDNDEIGGKFFSKRNLSQVTGKKEPGEILKAEEGPPHEDQLFDPRHCRVCRIWDSNAPEGDFFRKYASDHDVNLARHCHVCRRVTDKGKTSTPCSYCGFI
jgi:hypothetical protein